MFGIGGFELFIILIFGFLIFGPEKLPEIAKTIGKGIARFKQAQDEMNDVIKSTDIYDPNSDEPFKDPMKALDKLAQHQEEKRAAEKKAGEASRAAASGSDAQATGKAGKADEAASSNGAADAKASNADAPRPESFTERKARYERERAARKAAEQKAAEEAASAPADAGTPTGEGGKPADTPVSADAQAVAEGGDA